MSEKIEQQYLNDIRGFKEESFSTTLQSIKSIYSKKPNSYCNTIILYLTNLAELSNQFAILQKEELFVASVIISRSIFEECAILNRLFRESNYGEKSYFYKYLYIKDMYQDIIINKGWEDKAESYWRRIHNLLLQQFPMEIKNADIRAYPIDLKSFSGYSKSEKDDLKTIVEDLNKKYKRNYSNSKICANLFKDVYSYTAMVKLDSSKDFDNTGNIEPSNDIKVIYGQLCHYSHLNLTAIDEFNAIKNENGTLSPTIGKKIDNNLVILQWMKYSLDYILQEFKKYCDNKQNNGKSVT